MALTMFPWDCTAFEGNYDEYGNIEGPASMSRISSYFISLFIYAHVRFVGNCVVGYDHAALQRLLQHIDWDVEKASKNMHDSFAKATDEASWSGDTTNHECMPLSQPYQFPSPSLPPALFLSKVVV